MSHFPEPFVLPRTAPAGDGLLLRHWRVGSREDAETVLRGCLDPEFRRWNTPVRPLETMEDAFDFLVTREEALERGAAATFCVTDAVSGTALGQMSLNAVEPMFRAARVGYWVLPEARGKGVAGRALALASRWGFTEVGLHRLDLGHGIGHTVSCRVAERAGYAYEGTLRGAMFGEDSRDTFRDVHLHGRLATDPEPEART
ncbi:GNAT family N-acetyltransferase [Streptomyces tsukubensis]|uniref:GNAT family N-acetyltransferase n=1 Tax=Streptomyces tsukubensis TaxID=83656 RepID=A0A1V4A1N6_9ACTN|nr:GNAT family N-acetyltransferase [Streptomyces tsukubensis]OON72232.1 GNAT family N-acetyltransferase [Streptomyces tsukubensis]QFR94127.1 GNAT family N-acetyltransferase [Streptomyces tsukubensis]